MLMNDGSAPDHHPMPFFLVERADAAVQQGSTRVLKTALLVLAVSAIGAGVLTFADPLTRLAAVTASLVDVAAPQPDTRQQPAMIQSAADTRASPTVQSAADVQASPSDVADMAARFEPLQQARQEAPKQAPQQALPEPRQDMAAASEPAERAQAPTSESSEALFRQFQAWSQEQDSRQAAQAPQAAPAQPAEPARSKRAQSARDGSARVEADDRAPVRTAKRHRRVRALQNARAEMRSERQARARAARARSAEVRARAAEDARAQEQAAQNPQPAQPSPLSQFFGWQH